MGIDENERGQAILDAAAELLLRHGYNKTTMSDVANAVDLHRGLVYLHFSSKDALVEALIVRELWWYAEVWSNHLEADPLGGTVASVYRGVLHTLKQLPLMAAILTQDNRVFGKYLRKPGNLFARLPTTSFTRDFLLIMREAGVVRQDVNIAAMAFIMDTLSPAILETLSSGMQESREDSSRSGLPFYDELMETVAEMLERMLTPAEGADLEAGKAVMHRLVEDTRARFIQTQNQQKENKM
ncbi:MAG TPA: helix-turn-helix domain-containing protein [Ktedonobacteraceae bacterium]|jgi:AcrR family transcriptional regulator